MWSFYIVISLVHILAIQGQDHPVRYPATNLRGGDANSCPTNEAIAAAKNELRLNVSTILADIAAAARCGGSDWKRVGYLDMTDPSQSCPSGLALKGYSGLRTCGRVSDSPGCWSTFYNTGSSPYRRVCGRVRGYQFGGPSAFVGYDTFNQGIDGYYVEGVSLTHGQRGSRTHIWTFAVTLDEIFTGSPVPATHYCRCVTSAAPPPPPFVGDDYFCESGLHTAYTGRYVLHADDPLWDGQDCLSSNTCCEHTPYFTKTLPASTTDRLELRICSTDRGLTTDIPIDQVELYVQ